MKYFFLTPASIGYLTQFILSIAITIFLIIRHHYHKIQLILLTIFFCLLTLFLGLMFLDAVLLPFPRLLAVYAQNTVLAAALVFLIQFAYHFPKKYTKYRWVSIVSLVISVAYTFYEGSYMVQRYIALLSQDTVYYRSLEMDYFAAFVLSMVPIAFFLQCIESDPRKISWIKKITKPQGKNARGTQLFIIIFSIMIYLGLINILRSISFISTEFYNASLSIGILFTIWMFISNYINFIPQGVSVQAKLIILPLTLFLAIVGSIGWVISPAYVATYQPNLMDHQTIQFTPTEDGSYDVNEIEFTFEDNLGENIFTIPVNNSQNYEVNFNFPFFGKNYSELFITQSGVIALGQPLWRPNLQARFATFPAIIPLMIDLDPNLGGGVYVKEDINRLVVTWYQIPSKYQSGAIFTFQTILYSDGSFIFTYNGLPLPFNFKVDETPSANPWMRGVFSGEKDNFHTSRYQLTDSSLSGELPIIENYYLDFRHYLHTFIFPLMWAIIGGSLLIILAFPRLLRFSIIKPLENLLDGVHQVEKGDLDISIPIQNEDEIGLLTQHFNKMTSRLNELVTDLEKRVADRTLELSNVNIRLRKRLKEIKILQKELKEQSIRDPLTNAYNRRYMMEILEKELSRTKREELPLSLIMIDIDHFKNFNDEFGHQAGDMILQKVTNLIITLVRKEDSVCRFGGDEFMVILPKATVENARNRAEEFRVACEGLKVHFEDKYLYLTISLGITGSCNNNKNGGEMLKMADEALYLAKNAGRNCIFIHD